MRGCDEVALQEADGQAPVARITQILAAATQAIGDLAPVTDDLVRRLTVADRERLLLALHAATFGARQDLTMRCPACEAQIEVPLDIRALAEAGCGAAGERVLDAVVETPAGPLTVRCHPPSGADQEEAVEAARDDLAAASDLLLLRCIDAVSDAAGAPLDPSCVIDALREPVEALLLDCDPLAELRLAVACPECGHESVSEFDAFQFLRAVSAGRGSVFADVDRLARAYHWSEADILALPLARRRLYLSLLDGEAQ